MPNMKALSVKQPWTSLIAAGRKTIEVRTWKTSYRGPLLICASKQPRLTGKQAGVALCTATLIDCRPITHADAGAACCDVDPETEFAWIFEDIHPLSTPFPVSGKLGLFSVDDSLIRRNSFLAHAARMNG